ncbi:MAG: hypothetical protein EBY46_12510, partial [Rhodobacteraceae bacterium]|nr:hypothetical protein [Paracoccaceae bacterium]
MTYIEEVCAALLDDKERKYIIARIQLEQLKDSGDVPTEEHADQIEAARKEYLRASKEYLAI